MRRVKDRFERLGVSLVAVGSGSVRDASVFEREFGGGLRVLTDPSAAVYQRAGFVRGVLTVADPRSLRAAVRAAAEGFRQGRTQGHPFQQGGVLVFRKDGDLAWSHVSRFAGDHPEPEAVVAAVEQALGAPGGG